jgi:hypothetical protein
MSMSERQTLSTIADERSADPWPGDLRVADIAEVTFST